MIETLDDASLAPYAMRHEGDNAERLFPEEAHVYRTAFGRDRDRVIHSKAFRRLGYKTQVFVNSEGDNYRTRLTHSIEVSQIARSVAGYFRLNRDFAECLALAHDLGHTPFGHTGQDALHKLMSEHDGFEHNCQSLRIVHELESRYLEFNGLNLTRATLKGIMKHPRVYECDTELLPLLAERKQESPVLEAYLVDQCDRIAYVHHDLEDGLDSGLLDEEELGELEVWSSTYRTLERNNASFAAARRKVRQRAVVREMLNATITDLIAQTRVSLEALDLPDLDAVRALPSGDYPVRFSEEMRERLGHLQKFLFDRLYRHSDVVKMSRRGTRIIETLFGEYVNHSRVLPRHVQERIPRFGLYRVVSDYIAGMTDRFALDEYRKITGIEA